MFGVVVGVKKMCRLTGDQSGSVTNRPPLGLNALLHSFTPTGMLQRAPLYKASLWKRGQYRRDGVNARFDVVKNVTLPSCAFAGVLASAHSPMAVPDECEL